MWREIQGNRSIEQQLSIESIKQMVVRTAQMAIEIVSQEPKGGAATGKGE